MIAEFINPATLGFILIAVMLFAIFIGFPISFTLIFLGFVFGYLGFGKLVFYLMTLQFSMVMTEQTLAAVPLFVFMGIMMENAGLMERLFSAVQLMLSRVRGALFYAVLFVSVIFAAATGIVGASVTILGIMAAKSMNKSKYDVKLAAGTITAGGTLGILIPPSIMLVVMGPIMEIPVIDLFAAAIIPGILLASLYAGYTTIRCMINPKLGPVIPEEMRAASMKEVWIEFFLGLVPPAALVFAALGSILFGFATPTEAAGCGAMGALLLSLAYKKLTLSKLQEALVKTLEITALIMVLVAASNFFGAVFARLGTPTLLTEFLLGLEMNKYLILAMIMVMIFLLGWPLEWRSSSCGRCDRPDRSHFRTVHGHQRHRRERDHRKGQRLAGAVDAPVHDRHAGKFHLDDLRLSGRGPAQVGLCTRKRRGPFVGHLHGDHSGHVLHHPAHSFLLLLQVSWEGEPQGGFCFP